jgi:hypothetical protein
MCRFRNFGPRWSYMKYVRVPTQAFLPNYHLFLFTTRLIIFVLGVCFSVIYTALYYPLADFLCHVYNLELMENWH